MSQVDLYLQGECCIGKLGKAWPDEQSGPGERRCRFEFKLSKSRTLADHGCIMPERVFDDGNSPASGVDFQRQELGQTGSDGLNKGGKTRKS